MSSTPFRRALGTITAAAVATAAGASTVLALGCGGAAEPVPSNPEPRIENAQTGKEASGPLLWRVEGKNGPSFLFGTVHLGATLADVGPEVTRALEGTDTFISEANLDTVNPMEMFRMAMLPDGQHLEAVVGAESFEELVRLLSPGLPRAQLDKLKPWFAYSSVLQVLYGGTGPSIDAVLANSAKAAGKRMIYLETWQFQLGLLGNLIEPDDLKQILDPASKDRKTLEKLLHAYKAGDFEALTEVIASPEAIAEDPAEFKALFEDRNRAWVPTLLEHLERGGAFVAVGAGHYAGDVGLLRLLADAGIEATRVSR